MSKSSFKLPRPVFFLGWASFFTDTASEIIYPLLPIFLTTVLGASTMFVGLVEGVAESTAAFSKYVFGWWSDRLKKRTRFVVGGYGLANIIRPFIGLATTPWHVLLLRFTDRIGKGMRTAPRDAWIAGIVPSESRGRAYGFHRSMDHAGAVLGPILATVFLYFYPGHLRSLFLWSIIPGILATGCVLWAKKADTSMPVPPDASSSSPSFLLSPTLKKYLVIVFIFTLGGSSDAFLLLKIKSTGIDVYWIPLLWSALHVIKSSSSLVGGRMADQFGRKIPIVLGWIWYALIYFILGMSESKTIVVMTFLLYGLYYGLTESAERALLADMVSSSARGRAFGLFNLIEGFSMLPASLIFGYVWKIHGSQFAFWVSGGFSFVAAMMLLGWRVPNMKLSS